MYRKLFSICRIVTVTLLTTFFAMNSFVIFEHFISGKTLTSSSVVISDKGTQVLPALIICRDRAFNIKGMPMFKLTDYLENTLKLNYTATKAYGDYGVIENTTSLLKESIYSMNRGHCEVLKYTPELEPFQLIKIYFYPNSHGVNDELFFYLVHPGEEFFLHMSLWKTVPFGFKLDGKTEFMDLTMAKQVEKIDSSTNDCVDDLDYDYVGCLKEDFKVYSKVGATYTFDGWNYTYPNCTTPWHQSMLGITKYNDDDVNVCNSYDAYDVYYIDYKFAEKALQGKSKKCKESCYTIKYQGKPMVFQQDPLNMWWPQPSEPAPVDNSTTQDNGTISDYMAPSEGNLEIQNNNTESYDYDNETETLSNETTSNYVDEEPLKMRFFYMYYTTADETEFNTDEMIDLATFIGSVGGTLGLYLGFSFLGMLFPLYDYIEAAYARWNQKTKK